MAAPERKRRGRQRVHSKDAAYVGTLLNPELIEALDAVTAARGHQFRSRALIEAITEYVEHHADEAGLGLQEELFQAS